MLPIYKQRRSFNITCHLRSTPLERMRKGSHYLSLHLLPLMLCGLNFIFRWKIILFFFLSTEEVRHDFTLLSELSECIHILLFSLIFPFFRFVFFFFSLKFHSEMYLSSRVTILKHCPESLVCFLAYIRLTFGRVSQEHNKEAEMRFVQ